MEVLLLTILLALTSTLASEKKPYANYSVKEYYSILNRRVTCDFVLARIDLFCDKRYDEISRKAKLRIILLSKSCKQKLNDLDERCKDDEDSAECEEYCAKLIHECRSKIFDLRRYQWKKYYYTDDFCETAYDKYDAICEENLTGDPSSILLRKDSEKHHYSSKIKNKHETSIHLPNALLSSSKSKTKVTLKIGEPVVSNSNGKITVTIGKKPSLSETKTKVTLKIKKPVVEKPKEKIKITIDKKPLKTKGKITVTVGKKPSKTKGKIVVTLGKKPLKTKGKITVTAGKKPSKITVKVGKKPSDTKSKIIVVKTKV